MSTISDIYESLRTAYEEKQCHAVPRFSVIDRTDFILEQCSGKVVLDIGASGPLHEAIAEVAKKCYGIDREDGDGVVGVDLDNLSDTFGLPRFGDVKLIVCGEVIEHLANPGTFLKHLRYAYSGTPVIITVPNAASSILQSNLRRGIESVNSDHVAWYSWKTLSVLLDRYGYVPREWHWYHGEPRFAEGIICVAE